MKAGSFPCDFCASALGVYCYPTEIPAVEWHACPICVALIRSEDWTTYRANYSGFRGSAIHFER